MLIVFAIFVIALALYLAFMSATFATTFCDIFNFDSRLANAVVTILAILIPCGLTLLMIITHRSLLDIVLFEIILTGGLVMINFLLKLLNQSSH